MPPSSCTPWISPPSFFPFTCSSSTVPTAATNPVTASSIYFFLWPPKLSSTFTFPTFFPAAAPDILDNPLTRSKAPTLQAKPRWCSAFRSLVKFPLFVSIPDRQNSYSLRLTGASLSSIPQNNLAKMQIFAVLVSALVATVLAGFLEGFPQCGVSIPGSFPGHEPGQKARLADIVACRLPALIICLARQHLSDALTWT